MAISPTSYSSYNLPRFGSEDESQRVYLAKLLKDVYDRLATLSTSGAPADAHYVVTAPNTALTNASVLTAGTNVSITAATISVPSAAPSGTAGGDLAGTYPNPTIKASVGLTGTPTAPTAAGGTNTTQLATTAFVQAAIPVASVTSVFGRTGVVVAASADYSVAQVTGAAPLASPSLTGTPTAPTATVGTNTTQLATTAFVLANGSIPTLASLAGIGVFTPWR